MEITFLPKKYFEELTCDGLSAIPKEYIENILSDFREEPAEMQVKEANYGSGHDWIWVYLVFHGLVGVLALGDKINKGIDGWLGLGKKIKKLLKKVDQVHLDKDALALLCLQEIVKTDKNIEIIEKVIDYEIVMEHNAGFFINKKPGDFALKVKAHYIFSFILNENILFTFSADINGKIALLERIDLRVSNNE